MTLAARRSPRAAGRVAATFRADERGAASIEFVIVFPFLVFFLFALGEIGTLMARQVMLERGVDLAVRDIRLGRPGLTAETVKAKICEEAFLLSSCLEVLRLQLTPLDEDGLNFPNGPVQCIDRALEIQPPDEFDPGSNEEIVVMRACLLADPIFPGAATVAMLPRYDATGAYAIVVTTAFMNEPG